MLVRVGVTLCLCAERMSMLRHPPVIVVTCLCVRTAARRGPHGDDILALLTGASPAAPNYTKFVPGRDWCFTMVQGVGGL